ncbi:MAG: AmmeMemoRadiSam system protein B [Bacteroidota bacterium]
MTRLLPKLRGELDIAASPIPDRPGLLLRDPLRYSEAVVVVPPQLVLCLRLFDGAHSDDDLRDLLMRIAPRNEAEAAAGALARGLSEAGFVDDEAFQTLRAQRHDQFSRASAREAAHAGGGYPAETIPLAQALSAWIAVPPTDGAAAVTRPDSRVVAVAAPHVSPTGGVATYGAAYRALGPHLADRTFVILGTSHYGRPNRLGLTRKPFRTPLGEATTAATLVDELAAAAPRSIDHEDYCHAVEHSIEFQVLFLQRIYGPTVKILPILCGPFVPGGGSRPGRSARSRPEDDPAAAAGLDALARLADKHEDRLAWVLGVDMAHVGTRYGDGVKARAHEGVMNDVAVRDRARIDRIVAGDAGGFWDLVNENGGDDLKWCGSAPLYSFLRACPRARGRLHRYDQWSIDDTSVVTFAALAFHLAP